MDLPPAALHSQWSRLSGPWRRAFTLAWEGFCVGAFPVGAVVVNPSGAVASTGRNRRRETTGPAGELAGTNLAHAEVNALAKLPYGSYPDHTLLTTLEPCLLCTAALRHCHIGAVEYAAADPSWRGIERLPELNGLVARHWTTRIGPLDPPLRAWAVLFPLVTYAERGENGTAADDLRAGCPDLARLAGRLAEPDRLAQLRAAPLPEAFDLVGAAAAGSR